MFISAGHSEADPGACAFGRREADIACEFRNLVSFYLQRDKVPHALDGIGTENMPLHKVVAITSKRNGIEIEFHCDAIDEPRFKEVNGVRQRLPAATGTTVLCASKDNVVAAKISKAIADALGIKNRGVKPENAGPHKRLAFVQAGGMIVELFFISNPSDLLSYDNRKWVAAKAVADILKQA